MRGLQMFCIKHRKLANVFAMLFFAFPIGFITGLLNWPVYVGVALAVISVLIAMIWVSAAPAAYALPALKKLNDECDPYPLLEVCDEIIKYAQPKTDILIARINRCVALSCIGEYEKNLRELQDIRIDSLVGTVAQTKFIYYNNLASAYISLGDNVTAEIWYNKSAELLDAIKNQKIKEQMTDTHRFSKAQLLISAGKAEEGLELLNGVKARDIKMRVSLALSSAEANIKLKRYELAKPALEYVIANGNRLYAVVEAKKLLESPED